MKVPQISHSWDSTPSLGGHGRPGFSLPLGSQLKGLRWETLCLGWSGGQGHEVHQEAKMGTPAP